MGDEAPAGMSFEPSLEVRMICDQLDEFIEQEITPLETEYDRFLGEDAEREMVDDEGRLVDDYLEIRQQIREKSVEAGFYTMYLPEECGGGGLGHLEFTMVLEHLYNRNPDGFHEFVFDLGSINGSVVPLYHDEHLRERYFDPLRRADRHLCFGLTEPDHGSDVTHMDTTAEKDGDEWAIDGTKCFTSGSPYADCVMVHARTSGEDGDAHGISSFMIDADNPGWEVGKIQRPMGGEVGMQAFNYFEDCRVPEKQMIGEEGEGFIEMAIEWVGVTRLVIPAQAVGRSEWMFDQCVQYAENREAFGKPIGDRQFVQGMLAEMRTDIEMVRWLYRYAAWKYDRDEPERWLQSAAKLRGSELWNDVADAAVQIHGGAGYMRSLPFESQYRTARATRIYDGTDEIQKRTIARQFLST